MNPQFVAPPPRGEKMKDRAMRAFTLVELILVMALLVIVIAVAAPTLSRFFRGRALDTEAGRLLALTRYGASQAVSTGVPMILWINRTEGTYGLRPETGFAPGSWSSSMLDRGQDNFSEEGTKEYQLAKDLRFEVASHERITNGIATIRFTPDGFIDEISLPELLIRGQNDDVIPISQSRNRLHYEIVDKTNLWGRASP